MIRKLFSNPFTVFYLVFVYTIAFSLWWAYLLYAKNETAFKEKIELDKIHYQISAGEESVFFSTDVYKQSFEKYRRQRAMILMEGSVFVLLLVVGLMQVRKVFSKEIALASLQRNFLLSITHELKSPLTSIKASLQTLQRKELSEEKKLKLIENSIADTDRLDNLVNNILFAARIEREEHGLSKELTDVSIICMQVAKRFANNKKNIRILAEIEEDIYLKTDREGFASVVQNLVENALKYSPENSEINLRLNTQNERVYLVVADTGYGISDNEKGKIFQKFYRIGNEETRKSKGTGLGLYIVNRFVTVFEGKISVKDNTPSGTIFELEF